jgi:hypothetical protein
MEVMEHLSNDTKQLGRSEIYWQEWLTYTDVTRETMEGGKR